MASPRATRRPGPARLTDAPAIAQRKRAAAGAAADMVSDGMRVGLGTGSTVAYLLDALAARRLRGLRCVATSPRTELRARELGLDLHDLNELGELDLAIDGADQIDPDGWLIKGGGAAHTREKIVAAAARSFVVIASAEKAVAELSAPLPLELVRFGWQRTLAALGQARLRAPVSEPDAGDSRSRAAAADAPDVHDAPAFVLSPDGGLIADYMGAIGAPRELAARLSGVPGVVEHGLFAPETVSLILLAGRGGVQRRRGAKPDP